MARKLAAVWVLLMLPLTGHALAASGQGREPPPSVFGVRPVRAGQTTLEAGHFSYSVAPGASVSDAVVVANHRDEPLALRLYAADMIPAQGGALAPAQDADPRHETGAWLWLEESELRLAARESVTVPFELHVPAGTPPGDYPGAVVASTVASATSGLAVETRAALLVQLRVVGDLNPGGTVGLATQRTDGGLSFSVPVRNTGNVLYTVDGTIEITRNGSVLARLPLTPRDIYVIPGGSTTLGADWPAPAFGRVQAVAKVRATIARHEPIDLESSPVTETNVPVRTASAVAAATAGLYALMRLTRTRRRRRRDIRREARRIARELHAAPQSVRDARAAQPATSRSRRARPGPPSPERPTRTSRPRRRYDEPVR